MHVNCFDPFPRASHVDLLPLTDCGGACVGENENVEQTPGDQQSVANATRGKGYVSLSHL